MNEKPDNGKVVDLGNRQSGESRGGGLLRSVRDTAVKQARGLVASLFENVDDALFDLAERAENNAVQTQYFDGMREVRRKRQLVERLFLDNVARNFERFANDKPLLGTRREDPKRGEEEAELSLVDDRELEESLAVTSMMTKAEGHYARVLYAVNQRLSVISGGRKVQDSSNPVGPAAFAHCFREAMHELEVDVKVKLIVYKLFERYVLAGLDPLYDAVNGELVRAGVLPQLRHQPTRKTSAASAPSRARRNEPAAEVDDDYEDEAHAALREQLYATVNDLLSERRRTLAPRRSGPPAPVLEVTELLSALSLLQQQAPPLPADRKQIDSDDTLSLDELKRALHGQIEKLGAKPDSNVAGADEDTIDLVGMMFEYILEDRNLPAPMQALLGRLQIPYLKVALLDKHLFAQHSHPARRLLEALAEAAKGWSEGGDRDQRLFNEVKSIVETLLHNFDDDTGVFDRQLERFQTFVKSNKQRADVAEQRTAEASRGREKLQSARRTTAREVLSRLQGKQLPELIQNILTRPWANYLVLTMLRQGDNSAEWRAALRFMDELIWSAGPISSDADRERLRKVLPGIERHLRHGLKTVAFHDNDLRRLIRALGRFYHGQLGEDVPAGTLVETEEEAAPLIPESVEVVATPAIAAPPPADDVEVPEDSPELAAARALRVGTWVEFVVDEGRQRDRAKLSWISPISGKYLFVNRRGLKVCDMTLHALAASIAAHQTVVLEEVPLFDRALDAIVERLRRSQPEDGDKPAAAAAGATETAPDAAATPPAASDPTTATGAKPAPAANVLRDAPPTPNSSDSAPKTNQ